MAVHPWRCARATKPDECGWTGDAQDTRAGPPLRPDQVAWADDPWCPRCGEAAVAWKDGEEVYPVDGADVPSGVQDDERPSATVEVPRAELEAVLALESGDLKSDYVAAVEALKVAVG